MLSTQQLSNFLKTIDCEKLYLAFSGGVDSCVLLHQLIHLKLNTTNFSTPLESIYVNHNLSPNSHAWAEFAQQQCDTYEIPLIICHVNAKACKRQSPEAAARDARYQAFSEILTSSDCLLTAHHQNDQAETLLIQLFRGAGVKGLAAMPKLNQKAHYQIARPLLNDSKQQILDYAHKNSLEWVEDESNLEVRFRRNFLRHKVIPVLKETWPQLDQTLTQVSQHQAEAAELLDEIALDDLNQCRVQSKNKYLIEPALSVEELTHLSDKRIKNLLQFWLRENYAPVLTSKFLSQFLLKLQKHVDDSSYEQKNNLQLIIWRSQKQIQQQINQFELHIYRANLYLFHKKVSNPSTTVMDYSDEEEQFININQSKTVKIAFGHVFVKHAKEVNLINDFKSNNCLSISKISPNNCVIIRFRKGGEKFEKKGNSQHFQLKKWFQEYGIPEWKRDFLPLFYVNDILVQVADTVLNTNFLAKTAEDAFCLKFTYDC